MAGRSASSLWMGDIDQYMDERVIAEAFSMMGEHVLSVKLLKDHKTGQNRNYCFVELTSKEAVGLALRRLTGLPLPNYPAKRFKLNFSLREQNMAGPQPMAQGAAGPATGPPAQFPYGKEYSIYVGNLNISTTDEELLALFAHYKSIKEAKIVRDDAQRSKGFGFVRFYSEMDQESAILQMNGAVGPMGVTLKVDRAMPKRELNTGAGASGGMPMSTGAAVAALASGYQNPQYPYQSGVDPYAAYPQMAQQQPVPQQQAYQPQAAAAAAAAATPTPRTPIQQAVPQPAVKNEDDDETLEDHSAPVNMVATNLAYIQANQEFYKLLAESRWHPVTSYTATLEEVCK